MKPSKTSHKLKTQLLTKLPSNDVYLKSLASFCVLALIAAIIWFFGPNLEWNYHFPLASAEKRAYILLCLFLLWLLKLLLIDLDAPAAPQFKDVQTQQRVQGLQTRFYGALNFLKKTTITRGEKLISLNQLPWYLLMGPTNSGKTTLLANANIHFILQRQFQKQDVQNLDASENCDWWATRDTCLIDVPGKYLCAQEPIKPHEQKSITYPLLWRYFLNLTKRFRGRDAIGGIIIALPLPDLMKQDDLKKYHALLRELFQRIYELHSVFPQQLPCYLVITKCDLLSGFSEFFAESGNDEIGQAWGVTLPKPESTEKIYDVFTQHFNALIKKLNQQLLWRLHQERNPMARPYIKDFPLQVERLKEFTIDFIKRFSAANLGLSLQGVYLMSALQHHAESETTILEDSANTTHRAIQIFKEPTPISRAYFIKQFILQGLNPNRTEFIPPKSTGNVWKHRIAIGASFVIIGSTALLLGRDFEQGVNQAYSIQNYLSEYQLAIQKNQDPEEHLIQATNLLDTLQDVAKNTQFKLDIHSLMSFYSNKAQQKAKVVYHQALRTIFISEVKCFLEEYLRNPVNKNTEYVYAVLKAYLMLGDAQFFQSDYVLNTVQEILPRSLNKVKAEHLMNHLSLALTTWQPIRLNTILIQQTRRYFAAMPSFQLGYVILKTLDNNSIENAINLGTTSEKNSVFISRQIASQIPNMFTVRAFSNIISEETVTAAQEATVGNWVLGNNLSVNRTPELTATLIEQLRIAYVNNYIDVWETLVANIQLTVPKDILQLDAMLVRLIRNDSPLLQLLRTLHENTYFEPIASASPKLQGLGFLLDKNTESETQLYQIFASLQGLHQYIQAILNAENEKKAAFEAVSTRMLTKDKPDALTQLRLVAAKSPEPLRSWLDKISNHAWHFLMQDAAHYIDTSWQEEVSHVYQKEIANRYPFSTDVKKDVELKKFSKFFGKPGIIIDFYNHFLVPFIDTTNPDWHWKVLDSEKLPFPEGLLRQIQQALQINRTFFPNGDDKLYVQFALQPYKFGKHIKSVKFNINDKQILDLKSGTNNPHVFAWPTGSQLKKTSIQLILANQKTINRDFPGDWGWFKLINQSFESAVTKKEMLINLAMGEQPVRYLLSTEGQANPFMSLGLRHFNLPTKLMDEKA